MPTSDLAHHIDHTLLAPEATERDILQLCAEATAHGFHAVCVTPCRVATAALAQVGSGVAVCSVVGFPLGAATTATKRAEAMEAVLDGATEIDMVMNIGWLLDGRSDAVAHEIRAVRDAVGAAVILKVIIEAALLTEDQKRFAAELVVRGGGDFVKTATGFGGAGGATVGDVRLLKAVVGQRAKVKASGGIRDATTARAMIAAGADRLGTSAGVKIVGGGAAPALPDFPSQT